ncbi:MAG: hypothetical protein IJZ65_05325 [Ruminiclostridium sp.]|nr:hypothetical protein [Ruminiclostridium sp.]MBQ8842033.1 hypothetical protein [Ruminiclostridium sp.]
MKLDELRNDCILKQKRGLHFIIASVFIWTAILIIHLSKLPLETKNLFTFCCSAPLMPLAFLISKLIGIDFQNKTNPLTNLGIIFSAGQMPYLLIAMWAFSEVPEKMVMIYGIIFGAHLMPYGWFYRSKTYYVLSVLIPIAVLITGVIFNSSAVALLMIFVEIVFCICLIIENRIKQRLR